MKYIRSHHWHWTRQLNHTTKDINEVTCEIDIWWKLKCEANKKRRWHLWPGSKDELLHPLVDFGVNLALHQFVHFLQSFFFRANLLSGEKEVAAPIWRVQHLRHCNPLLQFKQIHCQTWKNAFDFLNKYIRQFAKIHLTFWTNTFNNLDKYIW